MAADVLKCPVLESPIPELCLAKPDSHKTFPHSRASTVTELEASASSGFLEIVAVAVPLLVSPSAQPVAVTRSSAQLEAQSAAEPVAQPIAVQTVAQPMAAWPVTQPATLPLPSSAECSEKLSLPAEDCTARAAAS